MKQIDNKKLCKYCLGCNRLENENFEGVMRCKYFIQGQADWKEKWKEALKNGIKRHVKHNNIRR